MSFYKSKPMRRICVVIEPMPDDLSEDRESLIKGYLDRNDFLVKSTDVPFDGVEPGDVVTMRDLIGVDVEIYWDGDWDGDPIILNWEDAGEWVDWK